jgi:hypothetical protein
MFELVCQLANLANLCCGQAHDKQAPHLASPLVSQNLGAEIGVNFLCQDKKAPTTVMLVLQ